MTENPCHLFQLMVTTWSGHRGPCALFPVAVECRDADMNVSLHCMAAATVQDLQMKRANAMHSLAKVSTPIIKAYRFNMQTKVQKYSSTAGILVHMPLTKLMSCL